jgi:hypothetical protein
LDPELADLKGHLRYSQEYTSRLGEIFDIYYGALVLYIAQLLLLSNKLYNL